MKLITLAGLLCVALLGQTTKEVWAAGASTTSTTVTAQGTILLYTTAPASKYITLDEPSKYNYKSVILRDTAQRPIAFCNITMGRCLDLRVPNTATK